MRYRFALVVSACAALAVAQSCSDRELPPLPEAIVVVDTDAPVPGMVDRLRVDFYDETGTWIDSRDLPRRSPENWPLSFSVYGENADEPRTVTLRLRAYGEGHVRDYRGERFMPRPEPGDPSEIVAWPAPPEGETPRLVRDGVDITPASEPLPALAIDRLVVLELSPGVREKYRIELLGACFGTMADLANSETCIDEEDVRVEAAPEQPAADPEAPTRVNEFGAENDCTAEPRSDSSGPYFDEEICVPGGAFVLGSAESSGTLNFAYASVPERVALMSPLLVDRYEVTVARWRRAREEGLSSRYYAVANDADAPLPKSGTPSFPAFCTYSTEPLVEHSRESYPVNCLTWADARGFCRFYGEDLLTEAQWEHAATGAGQETLYPWGNGEPGCEDEVFGRSVPTLAGQCAKTAFGPSPDGAGPGDETPSGVRDLGGSMSEWVLDSPQPYDSRCWASLPMADPVCWEDDPTHRSYRGGAWYTGPFEMLSAARPAKTPPNRQFLHVGFRCARPGAGEP